MKITVDLAANTGKFESEFKRAEKTVKDRMKGIEEAAKTAGAAIGAALAAGATAAAVAIKSAVDRMDAISKSASKIGIATEALSGLEFAARLSDVSLEQLSGGVLRLTKNLGEAAAGNKILADTFAAIGVATTNSDGSLRKTETVLSDVAEVFASLPDGAEKSKLALDLFGRSGAQLIPLLNAGRDGLADMTREAEALGLVFDAQAGKQAEEFNDALTRIQGGLQGAATQIGIELLPKLTEMAAVLQSESFRDGFGAIIEGAANATIKVAELVAGIGNLTRFVSEEAASRINGPQIGDTVRIEDAIARQREALQDMRGGFLNSIFPPGEDAPGIAAANAELARLEEMLRLSRDAAEQSAIAEHDRAAAHRDAAEGTGETVASGDAMLEALRRLREEQAAEAQSARTSAASQRERAKALRDAQRAIDEATRAQAQAQARAVTATGSLNQMLRQQAAVLGGPVVQASMMYAAELEQIAQIERDLLAVGPLTLQQQQALTTAREQANAIWVQDLEDIADASNEAGRYLEDMVGALTDSPLQQMIDDAKILGDALEDALAGKGKLSAEQLQAALNEVQHAMNVAMITSTQEGLRSIQSMTQSGSKAFAAMQVAIDALSVAQAISAVLNQGNGDPYTAFARMAAMAAAVATLVGNIGGNFGGSNGFTDTAAQRQQTQGTGTILGDSEAKSESILNAMQITADATTALVGINRGMLQALQSLQGGLDRAGGMLARGAGQAGFTEVGGSFSFGGAFLGGALSSLPLDPLNLLGGSQRITDQGIAIMAGAIEDITLGAFQEVQYRRWRFGSRRTREEVLPVGEELQSQFQLVVDSIVDTVRAAAEALGMLPAEVQVAIEAFRLEEIRISLKDLSAEEQQAELLAVFSSIFDGIAGDVVPFIEQFQRVGEGLGETLVRVATGVQVTQEALRRLGFSLDELDPERFAQVSEGLIDMVGGLDAFIEGMNTFMNAFAPESHRLAVLQDDLTRAFTAAGLVLPETRDGMWALMQSLDATTEAGQEQIATLLRLAGVANSYYTLLERQSDTELQDRIDHLENLLDANRAYYDFAEGIARQFAQSLGSDLTTSLIDIERTYRRNVATANELARAAGMAGAAERELARIELIAARQRAEAIRLTEESARSLAGDLGLTELSQLDAQISAFEAASQGIQSSIGGVSDAFDAAAQRAKETIDLLIGDLSPLRDAEKLQIALQGLQAGTVSADQVLQIGRRLYGSGNDYRQLFDQVLAMRPMPTDGGGSVGGGGGPAPIPPELAAMLARRDEILAQQAAAQARTNALTLVEQIGELSQQQAMTFEEIAAGLGIDLAGLAQILEVDDATLNAMLVRQAEESAELQEAVLEMPELFADAVEPITDELIALREQVAELIAVVAQVADNTGRTAGATESTASTTANSALVDTSVAPRSSRIGIGISTAGTGGFGPGGRTEPGLAPARI